MVVFVYKFRRIVGKPNFRDQFKKIIKRYKKLDIITWISLDCISGCKPISGFLFTVGQA